VQLQCLMRLLGGPRDRTKLELIADNFLCFYMITQSLPLPSQSGSLAGDQLIPLQKVDSGDETDGTYPSMQV